MPARCRSAPAARAADRRPIRPSRSAAMAHILPLAPPVGIGLKPQHMVAVLALADRDRGAPPPIGWVEVHPQNYVHDGGPSLAALLAIAEHFPVSLHSVSLSLGNPAGPIMDELEGLARLAESIAPIRISDHLSWSGGIDDRLPDLLPVPMTMRAMDRLARNIDMVQARLGRSILIENPSRYLAFAGDEMDEPEFIAQLCARTGCGLLLDLNNVIVSANNVGFDAEAYCDAIDPALVGEIHLAGHATEWHADGALLIDDHGSPVGEQCWALYERWIARAGAAPTLIEWDTEVPPFAQLLAEAEQAATLIARQCRVSVDA